MTQHLKRNKAKLWIWKNRNLPSFFWLWEGYRQRRQCQCVQHDLSGVSESPQ